MSQIIAWPFGWLMYGCYSIFNNYGVALIFFALVTKVVLFPLSIKQQKSTARMQLLNPKLEKLKKKYGKDKQKYQEEMMKLYSEEGANPMGGCLPLLIQMPILFGLYYVIYAPLTYILRFSKETVAAAKDIVIALGDKGEVFNSIVSNANFDRRPEIYILKAIGQNKEAFLNEAVSNSDKYHGIGQEFVNKVSDFDFSFLGINLGDVPQLAFNILILIPILSFIANLGVTLYTQRKSKKNNAGMQQMGMGMSAMLYVMPVISAIMTFQFPAGVGLYWIISSVLALFQSMILYKMYSPERMTLIVEKEKASGKHNKKRRPSMYERALEAQKAQQSAQGNVSNNSDNDDKNVKVSKSTMKQIEKDRLSEARRRMAEKYGDDYNE